MRIQKSYFVLNSIFYFFAAVAIFIPLESFAIIGGQIAEKSELKSTIHFSMPWCSGVKISDRFYLTAGHCVKNLAQDVATDFTKLSLSPEIIIYSHTGITLNTKITKILLHPSVAELKVRDTYNDIRTILDTLGGGEVFDLALIEVTDNSAIVPATLSFDGIHPNEAFRMSGSGPVVIGDESRTLNWLDVSESDSYNSETIQKNGLHEFRTEPLEAMTFTWEGIEHTFKNVPRILAGGDSGGPTYNKKLEVVGINSGANGKSSHVVVLDLKTKFWICTTAQVSALGCGE